MKKILIILAIILVVAAIAGGIYYFISRSGQTTEKTPSELPNNGEFPESTTTETTTINQETSKLSSSASLANNAIFNYWFTSTSTDIYAASDKGIIKVTDAGIEPITNSEIISLNKILPSPDGSGIIAKFNYPYLITFSIFNTINNIWTPLSTNVVSAGWSPDSKKIAYLDTEKLALLDLKTKKSQEIIKLTQKDLNINWIRPNEILLYETPSAQLNSSVWIVDIAKKTIKPFIQNEKGLSIIWSKEGDLGLKLTTDDSNNAVLRLINKDGDNLSTLSFITVPDKCIIEQRKIYCGVPQEKPGLGVLLPDDYYKKAVYFKDDIFVIDLNDGSAKKLLSGDNQLIDAYRLSIQNNKLYFLNRYDSKLYSLNL